ncbi:hypothetical protein HYC85_000245 [Camellia sinensis]|uniref:Protein kinase domain-containing protein n=1 Tax=Camellia sinensis TaxID=4442 RepID=A0A7J7I3K1_CAMSI|nr:hypothetical protein HYC85_000245 [Camellia sinensis]
MEKYKLFGPMERGSSIYQALDVVTNELVCLRRECFLNREQGVPSSVIREISFMREMQHRNILRLLDVVNKERSVHLVTEHVEHDLRKFMDTSPEIVKTLSDFLHQILSGLDYCHSHNILHRCLNPGSLMLDHRSQSTVKIAGFGSARTFGVPADVYTKWGKEMLCLNPGDKITASEALTHPYFTIYDSGSPSPPPPPPPLPLSSLPPSSSS